MVSQAAVQNLNNWFPMSVCMKFLSFNVLILDKIHVSFSHNNHKADGAHSSHIAFIRRICSHLNLLFLSEQVSTQN